MTDEQQPEGKRTIRYTVRGSIVGYIGRRNWMTFGERFEPGAEAAADAWVKELDQ